MSGHYPMGVTGFEFAIAGWDREVDEVRDVQECENTQCFEEWLGPITVEGVVCTFGRDVTFFWDCPNCGTRNQDDLPERDDEPDYDPYDDEEN